MMDAPRVTSNLQRVVRQDFPDFETVAVYSVALLRFHLTATAKTTVRGEVSVIGSFVLEAISLGQVTPHEIAAVLGIEERYVAIVGAELLRANLVRQAEYDDDGRRLLTLTPEGMQYLETRKGANVPRTQTYQLLFDPLTATTSPAKNETMVTPEQVQKEGLFVLPWRGSRPTVGDVTVDDVQEAATLEEREGGEVRVTRVIGLRGKPYPMYIMGTQVFALRHWETKERRFAAYHGGAHLPEISQAILDLERQGFPVVPAEEDASAREEEVADLPLLLRGDAAQAAREVLSKARELTGVVRELARAETHRTATQTERERAALEERVGVLEAEKARMEGEQQTLITRLEATQAKVVREDEHRGLLERALREAQREVIIVSPWVTPNAVNSTIVDLIRSAVRRGVRVRIAYGLGHQRDTAEGERKRSNARQVHDRLNRDNAIRNTGNLELIAVTRETHEKILVCDDAFAVATSFNWLSFRGPSDTDQRRETGFIVRDAETIGELHARAMELFASVPQRGAIAMRREEKVEGG